MKKVIRITEKDLSNIIKKVIMESSFGMDETPEDRFNSLFSMSGFGFEILERNGYDYVKDFETDKVVAIGVVPKRNSTDINELLEALKVHCKMIQIIGRSKHTYAPELPETIYIGVKKSITESKVVNKKRKLKEEFEDSKQIILNAFSTQNVTEIEKDVIDNYSNQASIKYQFEVNNIEKLVEFVVNVNKESDYDVKRYPTGMDMTDYEEENVSIFNIGDMTIDEVVLFDSNTGEEIETVYLDENEGAILLSVIDEEELLDLIDDNNDFEGKL